jgi:hypothetical protein
MRAGIKHRLARLEAKFGPGPAPVIVFGESSLPVAPGGPPAIRVEFVSAPFPHDGEPQDMTRGERTWRR